MKVKTAGDVYFRLIWCWLTWVYLEEGLIWCQLTWVYLEEGLSDKFVIIADISSMLKQHSFTIRARAQTTDSHTTSAEPLQCLGECLSTAVSLFQESEPDEQNGQRTQQAVCNLNMLCLLSSDSSSIMLHSTHSNYTVVFDYGECY